jgi:CBS domain-containing protein
MRNHKIGGLPVVADGQLVGIITETDLLDFLIGLLAGEMVPA